MCFNFRKLVLGNNNTNVMLLKTDRTLQLSKEQKVKKEKEKKYTTSGNEDKGKYNLFFFLFRPFLNVRTT